MDKYLFQKYLFVLVLIVANGSLIVLSQLIFHLYPQGKYLSQIPVIVMFAYKIITIAIIIVCAIFKVFNKGIDPLDIPQRTLVYLIPCYNENEEELRNTLDSFLAQSGLDKHKKLYLTVCDGRKKGKDNPLSTDKILSDIVFPNSKRTYVQNAYLDWTDQPVDLEILYGFCPNNFPYVVFIKQQNRGKRDSLAFTRRLLLRFQKRDIEKPYNNKISNELLDLFSQILISSGITDVNHLIGVDADTYFEPTASIELMREIERKQNILATTGLVRVFFPEKQTFTESLWRAFQHIQYMTGQGLVRTQQHLTQQKLNCLPGCINLTRINERTCGEEIMGEYTGIPAPNDHILNQIRGNLSQDRFSTTLVMKLYQDAHTTATWEGHSITGVPTSWSVFLSQRKRWSLGTCCNCAWMVIMPNTPIYERISAFCLVLTYVLSPYFFYSMVLWMSMISQTKQDMLFWILTVIGTIPTIYELFIPCWIRMSKKEVIIYYLYYPLFFISGMFMQLIILVYSALYMDDFGWGKTREVAVEAPATTDSELKKANPTESVP